MKLQISLAVTAYQEEKRGIFTWIGECVAPAAENDMVREITVVNDGTPDYSELAVHLVARVPRDKLKLSQNSWRLHVFGNKLESVYRSTSEWVLLCDSDNIMSPEYYRVLDRECPWNPKIWYCTSFARPSFDYRALCGTWHLGNIRQMGGLEGFGCFVNTGNQFVHRERFLDVFGHLRGKRFDLEQPDYFEADDRADEKWLLAYGAQDSFFLMKEWMLAGGLVHCVDGLEYAHRIGGGELSNYDRAPAEKGLLAPVYYLELLDAAIGEKHTYRWVRHVTRTEFEYRREDGLPVIVSGYGWVKRGDEEAA